ncbi:MAG TPA: response regulator transcription factor [Chitinophagaceae bacterium]|nr:response regulator transcription factor [Chitinophagaceae bacterium]
MEINLILADDHEFFRIGFKSLLKKRKEIRVIAEASNGKELIEQVEKHQPDIVVTDIGMPLMNGIEATRYISSKFPNIGVIALTMFDDENSVVDVVQAGAQGYLNKNVEKEEVFEAIHSVYEGRSYYCNSISKKLLDRLTRFRFDSKSLNPKFTMHELDVIKLICKEQTNAEIAEIMNLSIRTIEGLRKKIQQKMGAKNIAGIVLYAVNHRLVGG